MTKYVIVPVRADLPMLSAALGWRETDSREGLGPPEADMFERAYHRMVQAAPTPPVSLDEVREVLEKLIIAAAKYHGCGGYYLSETSYDDDGVIAEADAELAVAALPAARALLSKLKADQ